MRSRNGSGAMVGASSSKSSPSLLGEGDRPRSGWWRGSTAQAVAGAQVASKGAPLRQLLRNCHLPETSSGRI